MINHIRAAQLESELLEKKGTALLQMLHQSMMELHQSIMEKDAKNNIKLAEMSKEIAKTSKEDSSAMKTISVLGMIFLPGTYIATVFAMPVFNFDNTFKADTPLMKPAFRYYWAITLPLTVVIVLIWLLITLLP